MASYQDSKGTTFKTRAEAVASNDALGTSRAGRARIANGGSAIKPPTKSPYYPRTSGSTGENKARSILYNIDEFDEETARKNALRQARGQIKSIEDVYGQKEAEERAYGKKDLARSNTISAMTGMMGGSDATTRAGASDRRTNERVQNVQEQKAYAISAIYDKIDQNITKEKEAHLQSQRENAKNILAEVATNAKSALSSFASQGLSWEHLEQSDPDTLKELVRQTGENPFALRQLYKEALPPEKKPQTLFEGFKGNNFLIITKNPDGTVTNETYDSKELGIPEEFKDPSTITVGDTIYWYDKNAPVGEDGRPNLIPLGTDPVSHRQYVEDANDEDDEKAGYEEARQFLNDNPDAGWFELQSTLLEQTELNATEISALLRASGKTPPKTEDEILTSNDMLDD